MKFGIAYGNAFFPSAGRATAFAEGAEAAGFESIWTVEHVLVPAAYESTYPYADDGKMPGGTSFPIPDPLIWLTWVAAKTQSIRLATGILILPQRNPGVVAKEIATLDHLSGGRVELGVGAGWLAEEFAALGVPFDDRGKRLDGYIEALRALWSEGETTFANDFVAFDRAVSEPSPVQDPIPIVIGGHTEIATRRAGRIGDGFFPAKGDLPVLFDAVRHAADAAGRDPDAIELSTGTPELIGEGAVAEVERLAALGVERCIIPPPSFDPAAIGDALGEYAERVIAKVT